MKSVNWNKTCVRSNPLGVRPNRCQSEVRQERQEIREYLEKLRQLVPACPKAGKLSRLSVIQYVIDYIVELQDTLVHHPVNTILGSEDIVDLASSLHNNHVVSSLQTTKNATHKTSSSSPTWQQQHQQHVDTTANPNGVIFTSRNDNAKTNSSLNSSSKKSNTSNSTTTCRRPLGVLSSFKNHRNL